MQGPGAAGEESTEPEGTRQPGRRLEDRQEAKVDGKWGKVWNMLELPSRSFARVAGGNDCNRLPDPTEKRVPWLRASPTSQMNLTSPSSTAEPDPARFRLGETSVGLSRASGHWASLPSSQLPICSVRTSVSSDAFSLVAPGLAKCLAHSRAFCTGQKGAGLSGREK